MAFNKEIFLKQYAYFSPIRKLVFQELLVDIDQLIIFIDKQEDWYQMDLLTKTRKIHPKITEFYDLQNPFHVGAFAKDRVLAFDILKLSGVWDYKLKTNLGGINEKSLIDGNLKFDYPEFFEFKKIIGALDENAFNDFKAKFSYSDFLEIKKIMGISDENNFNDYQVKFDYPAFIEFKKMMKTIEEDTLNIPAYRIIYQEPNILLEGVDKAIRMPQYKSNNEKVFKYMLKHPNRNISKEEIIEKTTVKDLKDLTLVMKDLGFIKDLGKIFLKGKSQYDIYFRNPVYYEDFKKIGIEYIEPEKLVESVQRKSATKEQAE